jgi:urea transport system substrate-binding protein
LEGSKDLVGDWTDPIKCGNYNTKTKTCLGAAAAQ